ncbi:ATP phosphoribosyltransferase regulatory subunit [Kushneria phosphatilytica]|uniref:ATP phosphoribosyltransferase regulatory subunit n=1 Tax=Kushneria phosphatilytica TaxID=657387 RepID=A0A1S1NT57_9GAMM|nr:ATP phosphoribosyltransferase regulatory subunit [Kushneria phosphatilytica]OHV09960.1 ATP phosphoribosyltransferase regulatory subunit [Kushneria phosphatilytica]QEL11640.1 ATP phosphoribosyltransferase regulatory subunit [Kushneria phosphatilytica]
MTIADRWLLPDGMDEVLPPQALRMESLRRALLDLYYRWGYDMVMPPPVEFLDSLLTGTGTDLDLQTFKLTDQLTGRLMGASADVTPQVARMDAHSLRRDGPVRLCYCAHVLRAQADEYQGGRSPVQLGLELFGHAGLEADLEIMQLVLSSLDLAGARNVHLAIGHIGIYRALAGEAGLTSDAEHALFEALERKAVGEVDNIVDAHVQDPSLAEMLRQLPRLHGGDEVLERARTVFAGAPAAVGEALAQLTALRTSIGRDFEHVSLYFDLAELRGYEYHTGMVFAAYVPGYGQALAKGGRYDDTGRAFGRPRPATGCSMDLKLLASLDEQQARHDGIWAPAVESETLALRVSELRLAGERVVQALSGQTTGARTHFCDRELVERDGHWQVCSLEG